MKYGWEGRGAPLYPLSAMGERVIGLQLIMVKLDHTIVIGIGNIFRGDDAVGLVAARRLREMQLPGLQILELDGDITTLAECWQGGPKVIVVDAAASQGGGGPIFGV